MWSSRWTKTFAGAFEGPSRSYRIFSSGSIKSLKTENLEILPVEKSSPYHTDTSVEPSSSQSMFIGNCTPDKVNAIHC